MSKRRWKNSTVLLLTKMSWPNGDRGTDLQIPGCRIIERHIESCRKNTSLGRALVLEKDPVSKNSLMRFNGYRLYVCSKNTPMHLSCALVSTTVLPSPSKARLAPEFSQGLMTDSPIRESTRFQEPWPAYQTASWDMYDSQVSIYIPPTSQPQSAGGVEAWQPVYRNSIRELNPSRIISFVCSSSCYR